MKERSTMRLAKLLVGCAIITVISSNAHAAYNIGYVWDWKSNITTGNDLNGNHVWYYQYGKRTYDLGERTQNLQDLPQYVNDGNGNAAWQINNSVGNYPRIGEINWNMALAPSEVKDDSSNVDSHNVVLTWVSPVTGTLHIEGDIQDLNQSQDWQYDGVAWWLDKVSQGTASNLASGSVDFKTNGTWGDADDLKHISLDVAVNAGDSICFVVNAGWTQYGDNTAYNVTYTLVPEVSSLASLTIGGLLMAFKRRKRH